MLGAVLMELRVHLADGLPSTGAPALTQATFNTISATKKQCTAAGART
jgi:hypothetical protein